MTTGMESVQQSWSMSMLEHHGLEQDKTQEQHPQQQYVKRARKKLRDSCNSCALSKVKCSRDRPSCERCEDRGIYCRYSPSRRTGKRRTQQSIQLASGPQSRLPSLGMITPTEEPCQYDFDFSDFNEINDRGLGAANAQNIPDNNDSLKASTLSASLMSWDDPLFAMNFDDVENDSSDNFDFSSHSMMPSNHIRNMQDPSRAHESYPAPPSKSSNGSTFSEIDQADTQEDTLEPSSLEDLKSLMTILQRTNTPSSLSKSCPSRPRASISTGCSNGAPKDCMSIALDALRSLHRPHPACTMASQDPHSLKAQTLEIDHVLATNKEIIDSIAKTLKCSCSRDTQLALLLTVIGFKIIAWYSAVARSDACAPTDTPAHQAPSRAPSPLSGSGSASAPHARLAKPPAERVSRMPFTVGKYNLDGVSTKMHAHIALSELHRVVRLIEQLGKSFNQAGLGSETGGAGMDGLGMGVGLGVGLDACGDLQAATEPQRQQAESGSIGVALMTFLRDRVRSATNETMGILKESQSLQYHCF